MNRFRIYAILVLVSNAIYYGWLTTVLVNPLVVLFFILEFGVYLLILLFVVNNWDRRYQLRGGTYSLREIVDVFITTKNEDLNLVYQTIQATKKILHPNMRIYVLDDGDRPFLKTFCINNDVVYICRPDRTSRAFKAANLNFALAHSYGNYILTLDADTVPSERILDDLLGFFKDPKIALVTTRQGFTVDKENFNNDRIFYDFTQTGRNMNGSAISTGAGVIYRRSSLELIGGFSEWNLVEDLTTTFELNRRGFHSVYVSQRYVYGDAPRDLRTIFKQRGTWALDTMRLFFWRSPFVMSGLTLPQRLGYAEIAYAYLVSGILLPALLALNIYSLYFHNPILVEGIEWYLPLRIPSFLANITLFLYASESSASVRMWASLFPVFAVATVRALFGAKPRYLVTKKATTARRDIFIILPHLLLIGGGISGMVVDITRYGINPLLLVNSFWVITMIYFYYPVLRLGLFGKDS